MKVEIIIPVKAVNDYVRESIPEILKLDYQDFSILLLPDETTEEQFQKTRIIPTGKTGPAEKRDLALQYSDADIFAFLDDDAYPRKDWLTNAMKHFRNPEVGAVGGPAVTPEHDTFWQKVSGAVFRRGDRGGTCGDVCCGTGDRGVSAGGGYLFDVPAAGFRSHHPRRGFAAAAGRVCVGSGGACGRRWADASRRVRSELSETGSEYGGDGSEG